MPQTNLGIKKIFIIKDYQFCFQAYINKCVFTHFVEKNS